MNITKKKITVKELCSGYHDDGDSSVYGYNGQPSDALQTVQQFEEQPVIWCKHDICFVDNKKGVRYLAPFLVS